MDDHLVLIRQVGKRNMHGLSRFLVSNTRYILRIINGAGKIVVVIVTESDDIRFVTTCWAVIFVVEDYIYTDSVVVEIGIHNFSSMERTRSCIAFKRW